MVARNVDVSLTIKDRITKEYARIKRAVGKNNKQIREGMKQVTTQSNSTTAAIKKGSDVAVSASANSSRAAKEYAKTVARAALKSAKALKKQAEAADKAAKKTNQATSSMSQSMGDFAKRFGPAALVTGALTAAIGLLSVALRKVGQAINFVTETATKFGSVMSRVKAFIQPSVEGFAALSEKAKKLGATTAKTAIEVGQAFVELGKLGFNTAETLAATESVIGLAVIGERDLAESSILLASTLKQFNLEADQSNRVVDVMAKAFGNSALDANKLQESLKLVGTTAQLAGLSVEETTSFLAILAERKIDASIAGTSLNQLLIQLTKSGSKVNKIFKGMGKENLSVREKMDLLAKSNIDVGETFELLDVRAGRAANILFQSLGSVDKFTEGLENSRGEMNKMSKTLLDNVAGATVLLTSAQEGLGLAIGEAFGADKQARIEFYTKLIQSSTEWVSAHRVELQRFSKVLSFITTSLVKLAAAIGKRFVIVFDTIMISFNGFILGMAKGFDLLFTGMNKIKTALGGEAIESPFKKIADNAEKDLARLEKSLANTIFGKAKGDNFAGLDLPERPVSDILKPTITGDKLGGGGGDPGKAKREKALAAAKRVQDELALLSKTGLERELEAINQAESRRNEILTAANQSTLESEIIAEEQRLSAEAVFADKRIQLNIDALKKIDEDKKKYAAADLALAQATTDSKISLAKQGIGLAKIIAEDNKALFLASQGLAATEVIINTMRGIGASIALGPPGLAAVPLIKASGGIALATILAQTVKGFAAGGFVNEGPAFGDKTLARVNRGEVIFNPGQQRNLMALANGNSRSGGSAVNFNGDINIISSTGDPQEIASAVESTIQRQLERFSDVERERNALLAF